MGISMDSDFPQAELRHRMDQVAKGPSELVSSGVKPTDFMGYMVPGAHIL